MNTPYSQQLDVDRVELEKFKFAVSMHMERIRPGFHPEIEIERRIDHIASHVAYNFETHIFGQKLDEIKYPADWKEAFKERWFPKWLLKKYPVKYSYIEISALYPQLKLPTDQYKAVFHVMRNPWE